MVNVLGAMREKEETKQLPNNIGLVSEEEQFNHLKRSQNVEENQKWQSIKLGCLVMKTLNHLDSDQLDQLSKNNFESSFRK